MPPLIILCRRYRESDMTPMGHTVKNDRQLAINCFHIGMVVDVVTDSFPFLTFAGKFGFRVKMVGYGDTILTNRICCEVYRLLQHNSDFRIFRVQENVPTIPAFFLLLETEVVKRFYNIKIFAHYNILLFQYIEKECMRIGHTTILIHSSQVVTVRNTLHACTFPAFAFATTYMARSPI